MATETVYTRFRPLEPLEVSSEEAASLRAQCLLVETRATTPEGRERAAKRAAVEKDGPAAATARPRRSRPRKAPAKKAAAPKSGGEKTAAPPGAGEQNPDEANAPRTDAPEARKES